jgi:hypothetical protein
MFLAREPQQNDSLDTAAHNIKAVQRLELTFTMATIALVKDAILALKDRTGSSSIAISKYIENEKKVGALQRQETPKRGRRSRRGDFLAQVVGMPQRSRLVSRSFRDGFGYFYLQSIKIVFDH